MECCLSVGAELADVFFVAGDLFFLLVVGGLGDGLGIGVGGVIVVGGGDQGPVRGVRRVLEPPFVGSDEQRDGAVDDLDSFGQGVGHWVVVDE